MKVEIWSDVVCPWCYLGKRRFERALAQFAHRDEVEVVRRSFQLDPNSPRQYDGTLDEMLAHKMNKTTAQAAALNAQMMARAAQDGLEYHLDRARPGNTLDAHRLIHLATKYGLQAVVEERLLKAYFTDGEEIGNVDTLVRLVAEVGLDAEEARQVLNSDAYTDAVWADQQRAAMFGIGGVPFVAIDEKYGVSGAQSTEVFLDALEQAWADAHPLVLVSSNGGDAPVCEDENCAV